MVDRPLLTRAETKIADHVLRNTRQSQWDIMDMLYSGREDGGAESIGIVGVHICSINKKLKPQGIRLQGHKGYGYKFVVLDPTVTEKV